MPISDERISEFIDLWEKAFGERIPRSRAVERAQQLLELYRAMASRLSEHRLPGEAPEDLSNLSA